MAHLWTGLTVAVCLLVATSLIDSTLTDVTLLTLGDNLKAPQASCKQNATYNKLTCKNLAADSMDVFRQALSDAVNHMTPPITVVVKKSDLSALSSDIFAGVSMDSLKLVGNSLTAIPWAALTSVPTGLEFLTITGNNIATIDVPQFKLQFLDSLTSLDLSSNQVKNIANKAFSQFTALTTLSLKDNALTSIGVGQLDGLTALTTLTISDNLIHNVAAKTFSDLTSVTTFDMSSNSISTMYNGTFDGLEAVTTINLSGNYFICDCVLQWLKDWLVVRSLQTTSGAYCLAPAGTNFTNNSTFC